MKADVPEVFLPVLLEAPLLLSSTLYIEEITEQNLDTVIYQFAEIPRNMPDIGMRNFESEVSPDLQGTVRAQSLFALYVLGKMTPTFDFWDRKKGGDVHDPS